MPLKPQPAAAGRLLSTLPSSQAGVLSGVKHGFFGREGGVSSGIYASLNAGTGSNDDPANVLENRRRIAEAFGIDRAQLTGVHQVHSATAFCITGPFQGERPRADALVTTTPGLAISILTADCTPILFADTKAGVIGAAHAGWRGALDGVIQSTVWLMCEFGADPTTSPPPSVPAFIKAHTKLALSLRRSSSPPIPPSRFFVPGAGDRLHFDLPDFCASRLEAAGVKQIETLPLDTYAESTRLHSHRRSVHEKAGDYGRNCSVIMLG